jgi:hypothetical protein
VDHERDADRPEPALPTNDSTATPTTTRTRECELAGCEVVFPVAGKKKYCTKEHANEAARRRTVLETLAVDIPLEELRLLRDQVVEQVGPDVTRLIGQLGEVLDRFGALETGAVARIAAAEQAAADATATAQTAEQTAADAERRATDARQQAEHDRTARAAAERAQRAAEDQARAAEEDRVRADTLKDAAIAAAAAADFRAELSAAASLDATQRAAEERTRADALQNELSRARAEHTAEVTRLGQEARAAVTAVQDRTENVLRLLADQADARVEGLRALHVTEVEQVRSAAAVDVAAARAETDRVNQRHTDAVREVERERARGRAARDQLLREVRRTLGEALDVRDGDGAEEVALAQRRRVDAVLRNLDDIAERFEGDRPGDG